MISGKLVSVGVTATVLAAAGADRNGISVTVQVPSGGATVYLGGANVTTTVYGHALAAGGTFSIELARGESLYGIVAAATQNVGVLISDAIG